MMQLPGMEDVSYVAHGCFIITLIMALLASFFTCLQQRTYGFLEDSATARAWLMNGVRYTNAEGKEVFQSSTVSHQLLQVPFELLCISITTFIGGIGVYLGCALTEGLQLGGEESSNIGNRGVLITFLMSLAFALGLLGQLLGLKDMEYISCRDSIATFKVSARDKMLNEEIRLTNRIHQIELADAPTAAFYTTPTSELREIDPSTLHDLANALKTAAASHRASAAADAELARIYGKML